MSKKLKAIILILAIVIGGIFVSNMPSNDNIYKRKYNDLKTQVNELSNYNNSLKEQNKVYESQIGDLTTENNSKDATIEELQSKVEELEAEIKANKKVTNLINTIWVFNDTITADAGYGEFHLNFNAYDNNDEFLFPSEYSGYLKIGYGQAGGTRPSPEPVELANSFFVMPAMYGSDYIKRISIFDGSDVENTKLIDWLYENAVLVNYLVSFSIGDVTYFAETGMTWGEWCDSSYNIDGFTYTGVQNGGLISAIGVTEDTILEDGMSFLVHITDPDAQ